MSGESLWSSWRLFSSSSSDGGESLFGKSSVIAKRQAMPVDKKVTQNALAVLSRIQKAFIQMEAGVGCAPECIMLAWSEVFRSLANIDETMEPQQTWHPLRPSSPWRLLIC